MPELLSAQALLPKPETAPINRFGDVRRLFGRDRNLIPDPPTPYPKSIIKDDPLTHPPMYVDENEEIPVSDIPDWQEENTPYEELVRRGEAPKIGGPIHSVEIMPDMPDDAPYNLGAGFGSTELRRMLESGQGKFQPQQLASEFGKMSQDERDMLGFQGWQPNEPVSREGLAGEANKRKMMLGEVVKGGEQMLSPVEEQDLYERIRNDYSLSNRGMSFDYLPEEQQNLYIQKYKSKNPETKFQQYQLPGGENYQETLLTLPDKSEAQKLREEASRRGYGDKISEWPDQEFANRYRKTVTNARDVGTFKSSHWDEPNILAHYRTNDRMIGGKPSRFIEEVQSDWHQKGRDIGYKGEPLKYGERIEGYTPIGYERKKEIRPDKTYVIHQLVDSRTREVISEGSDRSEALKKSGLGNGVPNAPFKKTWHELAMKHALAKAAREGKEAVGWTTGEQQAERYDLSKQVREISWNGTKGAKESVKSVSIYPLDGNPIEFQLMPDGKISSYSGTSLGNEFGGKHISDVVGKDIGKQILESTHGELNGSGLKVGGEGMKGFYDQILPQFANKYTKKWGGRVGEGNIRTGEISNSEQSDFDRTVSEVTGINYSGNRYKNEKIHSLDITPSMKEALVKVRKLIRAKKNA